MLWLHAPLNAVLLALLIAVGFCHMQLGMRVVVEDYIHKPMTKAALLLLNLFVCLAGRRARRLLDPEGRPCAAGV